MPTFKKGDLVIFTDTKSTNYQIYSKLFGKVLADSEESRDALTAVCWYRDEYYAKEYNHKMFYSHRLSLATSITGTPVERKCKYLWNKSKYVKNNPTAVY